MYKGYNIENNTLGYIELFVGGIIGVSTYIITKQDVNYLTKFLLFSSVFLSFSDGLLRVIGNAFEIKEIKDGLIGLINKFIEPR